MILCYFRKIIWEVDIMFEETKFENKNKKIVEIVSSMSAYELLKRSGNNNLKISLPLELSIGKLDSINDLNRNELKKYTKYINGMEEPFEEGYNFKFEFDKLKEFLKNAEKIRVWSSHLDCDDYCLLLFICNFFENKNISVVYSEEYNWYATTCIKIDENEINELTKKEHNLKKYEIEQYKKEWEKIVEENTELRFMMNGSVKSVNINHFDNKILERLKILGETNIYFLVADLILNPIVPFVSYSDYIYLYLIHNLIDNKFIKKVKKDDKIFIKINEMSD